MSFSEYRLLSLQDIKEKEWAKLKEKVRKAKGKVIVLVHPFFQEANVKKSARGLRYHESLIYLLKESKTPIVILEEAHKVKELREKLRELNATWHLILPTGREVPAIMLGFDKKTETPVMDKEGAELVKRLKKAGANTVSVGGSQVLSWISPEVQEYERKQFLRRKQDNYPISKGCAGITYHNLIKSKKFKKVRLIPQACWPHKPEHTIKRMIRHLRAKATKKPSIKRRR